MASLTDLIRDTNKYTKQHIFLWTNHHQEVFDNIKEDLIKNPGLLMPDPKGEFILETDASGDGCGAVLYQMVKGTLYPVWYLSKKFSEAERNYNTRDREALAIIWAFKKCQSYLALRPFIVYSDHESLSKFIDQPKLKGRDWRWAELISAFKFVQRYRKGEEMVIPDTLSRAFAQGVPEGVWDDIEHDSKHSIIFNDEQWTDVEYLGTKTEKTAQLTPVTTRSTRTKTQPHWHEHNDEQITKAKRNRPERNAEIHEEHQDTLKMKPDKDETNKELKHKSYKKNKRMKEDESEDPLPAEVLEEYIKTFWTAESLVNDESASIAKAYPNWIEIVKKNYHADPFFKELKELLELPEEESKYLAGSVKSRTKNFRMKGELIFFTPQYGQLRTEYTEKLCIPLMQSGFPQSLRMLILYDAHDSKMHLGTMKTFARVSQGYWWPGMKQQIKRYVQSCKSCATNKFKCTDTKPTSGGKAIPGERMEEIQMDFITDLPPTTNGYDTILVVVDRLTKFAYFIAAKKTDSARMTAVRVFERVFSIHGAPKVVHSDRDTRFTSLFYASLMKLMGVNQAMNGSKSPPQF